jgi:hypothetical protein
MAFFDPTHVDLTAASQADVICYFQLAENEYNGYLPPAYRPSSSSVSSLQ